MTKTVMLALEWRNDDELFVGPHLFGRIVYARSGYIVVPNFNTTLEHYYPTREAAMAALEAAVMAMGPQAKQQER